MRFQKNTVAQLKQDKSQPTLNIPIYRHVGSWLIRFGYQEGNLDARPLPPVRWPVITDGLKQYTGKVWRVETKKVCLIGILTSRVTIGPTPVCLFPSALRPNSTV